MAVIRFNISCWMKILILISSCINLVISQADDDHAAEVYSLEGKVFPPDSANSDNWQAVTRVIVNGGDYLGFLKKDGTFAIYNVPSGSYVIEIVNPNYSYEPVRVEINSKGKYRARKVNYVQLSQVIQVAYPLKMKPLNQFRYFQVREQWRITDFLFSPMVLMMVLPLVLIMILPKMMNDPETRKEMEQLNNLTKYDIPEMSEMLTTLFAGNEKQNQRQLKPIRRDSNFDK